jgi:hypothetical protein
MNLTEQQAIELAAEPHKIIDFETCNTVIGFLNGYISDMALAEFELEIEANNHEVLLLHTEGKTNAVAKAEFKISKPYKDWREMKLKLAKLRAYRKSLQSKEESLRFKPRDYHNMPRAI